jgi:hypothetical protein
MAGVTPDATTSALAAEVPKESGSKTAPGSTPVSSAAPQSSATELARDAPLENSGSVPGTYPETPAKEQEQLSVNPIAASSGFGNPIKLKPGEPVPDSSTFNSNTVQSTVTTDKAGYDADASYPVVPGLPPVATKPVEAFAVPATSESQIAECNLPENPPAGETSPQNVTIQSAAPTSTTAALAAQVPLESQKTNGDVPDVVKQSISLAHTDPEATANAEAVEEKKAVEEELQKKIEPEEASAAAATSSEVPGVVKDSLKRAHEDPEAAANNTAVEEKKEVEDELQQKVPIQESAGEPAPTATAATTTTAPAATNVESGQVSPMTTPAPSQPTVTTGVREAQAPQTSTPEKPANSSPGASNPENGKDKKKKNRGSGFFSKLKEKLR